jgi:hypothetical protein
VCPVQFVESAEGDVQLLVHIPCVEAALKDIETRASRLVVLVWEHGVVTGCDLRADLRVR